MSSTRSLFSVRRSASSKAGFTLVELLVATTITIILAGIMVGITSTMMSVWNRSRGSLTSSNQAKILQDQLTADLESAIVRNDDNVWFAATVQPDQSTTDDSGASMATWSATGGGIIKPGWATPGDSNSSLNLDPTNPIEDYRFGQAGLLLRFFTNPPDANDSELHNTTAPRAVAYQIVRYAQSSASGASVRYGLFRSEVRPFDSNSSTALRSTFNVGYNLFSGAYNDPSVSGYALSDPGTIRRANLSLLVANNVIDFGVRLYQRNSSGAPVLLFPTGKRNLGFAATTDVTALPSGSSYGYRGAGEMTDGFPDVIEVFVRILSDEGAVKIEALETGKLTGVSWWDLAKQNSRVMTWRVDVKSHPLFQR